MLIPSSAAPSPLVTNNPPIRTRSLSLPSTSQCCETASIAGKTSDSVPPRLSAAPRSPPLSLPAPPHFTSTSDKAGSCSSPWFIRELSTRLSNATSSRHSAAPSPHAHILENTSDADATVTETKWVLPSDASEEESQRILKSWAHAFRNALPDQEERYLCILSRCIREFRNLGYEGDIELPHISSVSTPSVNTTISTPSAPYSRIPISKVNRRKDKKNLVGLVGKCVFEREEYIEIDGELFLQTDVVEVRIEKRGSAAVGKGGNLKRSEGDISSPSRDRGEGFVDSRVISRTEDHGDVSSFTPQKCASASTAEERRVCSSFWNMEVSASPTTRSGLHPLSADNLAVVTKKQSTTKTGPSLLASAGSVDEAGMPTSMSTARDRDRDRGDSVTVNVKFVFNSTTIYRENIYLTGSLDVLKNWSSDNALLLSSKGYPFWEVILTLPANTQFSYTYLRKNNGVVSWEPDQNRSFTTPADGSCILNDTWRDTGNGTRTWR